MADQTKLILVSIDEFGSCHTTGNKNTSHCKSKGELIHLKINLHTAQNKCKETFFFAN